MRKTFTTIVLQEGEWFIAQCLEVDIASQGKTEEKALENLSEALALHFTPPIATILLNVQKSSLRLPREAFAFSRS
jgi:predicted RNase H-like HicB family nuclease